MLAAGRDEDGSPSDAERRFEDARTLYHSESRKLREELKWRRMAEERIGEYVPEAPLTAADLEAKLTTAGREVEDAKAARAKDAQDLLANAKERLAAMHEEVCTAWG